MEGDRERPQPRRRSSASRKSRQMSKEQVMEALRKKKECNAKAQKIVEKLMESSWDSEEFLIKLKDINQCHYDDIVEERSITRLCGYPLCKESLENIPEKQYLISTALNKVFDITERKKFCSTSCYKASTYIKEQMLTSPLWLREQEIIPDFELLSINKI